MIDENKVRLMTKIAIYEKKEGNRNLMISKFYRSDYVRYNVLKTLVAVTFAFWVIIGAYAFIKFDDLLAKVSEIDYFEVMYKLLGIYVFVCLGFFFFAQIVYSYRYSMAKPGLIKYNVNLKRLITAYGVKRKKKKSTPDKVVGTVVEDELALEFDDAPQETGKKIRIKKTDMISKRQQIEEEERNQQIIENAQRRKEWLARKAAEKAENERLKEEQRRQREQALLEQHRLYAQQNNIVRPDYIYQDNPNGYANQSSDVSGRSDN